MRKMLAAALLFAALPASAGLLTPGGVAVFDAAGNPRTTFSNNETMCFSQTVHNGAASPNRTYFRFDVAAPNGNISFRQAGNAVPGSVGNASARVCGIKISGFFQGPGSYAVKAYAALDGITLEQDVSFAVSSPNVLLIYPPNGATGLTDNPLTFQWFSSGAATYRVTVGDNPSLYNAWFVQNTGSAANNFTYPQNPADPRQRLVSGQMYYWKIEGLDTNGNVVAQSQSPFMFSVAGVSITRDMAVTALDVTGAPDAAGNIPFRVTVKNQGSTTESNVPLKFTLGGLPAAASPIALPPFNPGDVKTFDVPAIIPPDQAQSLAIACLTIFDDNVNDNCKTLAVSRPVAASTGTLLPGQSSLTPDQLWQAISTLLQQQGVDLTAYQLVNMEGSLSANELAALLDQLRSGQASAQLSGPPITVGAPAVAAAPAPGSAPAGDASTAPSFPSPLGPPAVSTAAAGDARLSADEAWLALEQQLALQGVNLSGYQLVSMEGTLTRNDIAALIGQLTTGAASASVTGSAAGLTLAPVAPVPAPAAEPSAPPALAPDAGENVDAEEVWQTVKRLLAAQGVDLSAYTLTGMDGRLTRDELGRLAQQLAQGQSSAALSGPPLTSGPAPAEVAAPPAAGPAPVEEAAAEWSGYTRPASGSVETRVADDASKWQALWKRASDEPVPKVDFKHAMVVGVVGARGKRFDRVEIEEIEGVGTRLDVRYRFFSRARFAPAGAPSLDELGKRFVPYIFKAVPRDYSKVRFDEIKED